MDIARAGQLNIKGPGGSTFYGGDQSWFTSSTHALCGCSSIAAANALRLLARSDRQICGLISSSPKLPSNIKRALCTPEPTKEDYCLLIERIYKTIGAIEIFPVNRLYDRCNVSDRKNGVFKLVKPSYGQTNTGFIIGVIRFARVLGISLGVKTLSTAFCPLDEASDFIKEGLQKSGAVVMMTSFNRHPAAIFPGKRDFSKPLENGYNTGIKNHFVTITDIDEDTGRILISTWGKAATCDLDKIHSSWQSVKAFESTLMYIYPANFKESLLSLIASFKPYISGIINALLRRHIFN